MLQQQRCQARQALEGSLLHERDLVLLQIQTGHTVVSEEGTFAKDFDAVACQKEVFRWSGPGVRGGNGCEATVLTVYVDIVRICRLSAVGGSGRVGPAMTPGAPQPDTNNEPRLLTQRTKTSEQTFQIRVPTCLL